MCLNECTYQIHLVRSTLPYPDLIQQLRTISPLTTETLLTTDRYYVFRAQRACTLPRRMSWIESQTS